eukprot:5321179-Pyramimonas_sp.AAC.1
MTRADCWVVKPSHRDMNSVFIVVTASCSDDFRFPRKLSTSSACGRGCKAVPFHSVRFFIAGTPSLAQRTEEPPVCSVLVNVPYRACRSHHFVL